MKSNVVRVALLSGFCLGLFPVLGLAAQQAAGDADTVVAMQRYSDNADAMRSRGSLTEELKSYVAVLGLFQKDAQPSTKALDLASAAKRSLELSSVGLTMEPGESWMNADGGMSAASLKPSDGKPPRDPSMAVYLSRGFGKMPMPDFKVELVFTRGLDKKDVPSLTTDSFGKASYAVGGLPDQDASITLHATPYLEAEGYRYDFPVAALDFSFLTPNLRGTVEGMVEALVTRWRAVKGSPAFPLGLAMTKAELAPGMVNGLADAINGMAAAKLSNSQVFSVLETPPGSDPSKPVLPPASQVVLSSKIADAGSEVLLTLSLVDRASGASVVVESASVPRSSVEADVNRYVRSTFQSSNGIFISGFGELISTSTQYLDASSPQSDRKMFSPRVSVTGVEAGYRLFDFLAIGLGFSSIQVNQFDIPVDPSHLNTGIKLSDNTPVDRFLTFSALGPKVFLQGYVSPIPQLNIGLRAEYMQVLDASLHYEMSGMKTTTIDWSDPLNPAVKPTTDRVLADGIMLSNFYFVVSGAVTAEFLISPRLSVFATGGYTYTPPYIPDTFRSNGKYKAVTKAAGSTEQDADANGTFPEYLNYNFARVDGTTNSNQVGFNLSGFQFSFGLSFQF